MPFDAILGQDPAIQTLRNALRAGRVHHAYRFEGPPGVGKEMAALALAQALVCERREPLGCGECSACHRAVTFSEGEPRVPLHPDVVIVQRGLYRSSLGVGASEATGISIEQIRRVVLERSGFPPHEGRALVFIVRDADELTVQAANALLKTLEEPGQATHFVLLTSRPNRLLDTIRSRTLPVRFAALSDALIAQILESKGLSPAVAPLAQGSATLAIELASDQSMRERDEFVSAALEAIQAPDLATATRFAESRKYERDTLRTLLSFFAQHLARTAREVLEQNPSAAEQSARRHAVVLTAMTEIERNAQPVLTLEALLYRLREI